MDRVFSTSDVPWRNLSGLAGARGYEFLPLVADDPDYTSAFSCELVRLGPADHSVPHTEPWNHALYFLEGEGELRIGEQSWPVRAGSFAKVKAGERHSLKNAGPGDMIILAIYDPPRRMASTE